MDAVTALAPQGGLIAATCTALGLSRASLHRREAARKQPRAIARARPKPLRAMTDAEQQHILEMLRGPLKSQYGILERLYLIVEMRIILSGIR